MPIWLQTYNKVLSLSFSPIRRITPTWCLYFHLYVCTKPGNVYLMFTRGTTSKIIANLWNENTSHMFNELVTYSRIHLLGPDWYVGEVTQGTTFAMIDYRSALSFNQQGLWLSVQNLIILCMTINYKQLQGLWLRGFEECEISPLNYC